MVLTWSVFNRSAVPLCARMPDRHLACLNDFVLLVIGNDWKSKGLPCILDAAGHLDDPNIRVLVVGSDNPAPFREAVGEYGLAERVHFLPSRPDVEFLLRRC